MSQPPTSRARVASAALLLSLLAPLATLPSCASKDASRSDQPAPFLADAPPVDFTLAVTTYARPGAGRRASYSPDRTPARYVFEPSGVLHVAVGAAVSDDTFPGETRHLSADQVQSLWTRLQDSGLLRADHPAAVGSVTPPNDPTLQRPDSLITAPPVYSVFFAAGGVRRTLALSGADAEAARPLVSHLAQLAWIGQR